MCIFQGDRLGICVTQFDPKLLERGLVCAPGALPTIDAAIISVQKIPYYKGAITTKSKFHVTMGHDTVMARVMFFGLYMLEDSKNTAIDGQDFNFAQEYKYQDELLHQNIKKSQDAVEEADTMPSQQFALLQFEKPVTCAQHCMVIGAKLDIDIHTTTCRLAFYGKMLHSVADQKYTTNFLPKLKIFKNKAREGVAERKVDDQTVICRGLFKKESNIELFTGLKVKLSTGEEGVIEGGFGQSGKFKIRVPSEWVTDKEQSLEMSNSKHKPVGNWSFLH